MTGDPALEPWIAQGRRPPGAGPRCLWEGSGSGWTYLAGMRRGVHRYLKAMDEPRRRRDFVVGVSGLGRVGGLAASALAAADASRTRIGTLLIHDSDTHQPGAHGARSWPRWPAGGATRCCPGCRPATLPEMMRRCDAFLFAAATRGAAPGLARATCACPSSGPTGRPCGGTLDAAAEAGYTGLFFVVSDPVELLAQAAFYDSNASQGGYLGHGLAPERVAGLALGIMWGRALAKARAVGEGARVARTGVPYGPHSQDVLVFDDPADPGPGAVRAMTQAARTGNYRIRDLGYIPYIGPALSSIALTLPALLAGREIVASSFVDGIYFGAPCRLRWGVAPTRRRVAPEVREQVARAAPAGAGAHDALRGDVQSDPGARGEVADPDRFSPPPPPPPPCPAPGRRRPSPPGAAPGGSAGSSRPAPCAPGAGVSSRAQSTTRRRPGGGW